MKINENSKEFKLISYLNMLLMFDYLPQEEVIQHLEDKQQEKETSKTEWYILEAALTPLRTDYYSYDKCVERGELEPNPNCKPPRQKTLKQVIKQINKTLEGNGSSRKFNRLHP